MKKIYTFADLTHLEANFKKVAFTYEDSKYSTFYHRNDNTPQIKNVTNNSDAIKYSSFMYAQRELLKIEQPTKEERTIEAPAIPATIDKLTDVSKYISDVKELSKPFLELMQLPFKTEYENHPNIKLFDFSALDDDHQQSYKIDKIIPTLFFQNEDSTNVRYKHNGDKKLNGWYTLSDIYSRGAFLTANGKASTLILLEGLKDGINANIILNKNCDVLIVDSKASIYDFKLIPNFTVKKYKQILFIQDKNVTEDQMLKMIQGFTGEKALLKTIEQNVGIGAVTQDYKEVFAFYEKIRFYNPTNYTEKVTDFTDTMESFNLTNAKLKRTALKRLKDGCSTERFIDIYIRSEVKILDNYLEIYMNTSNIEKFMFYTLKKISMGGDIEREFKYYMNRLVQPPKDHSILHLNEAKFLSLKTKEISDFFKTNSHVLIGSSTGTGKSNVVQGIIKDEFLDENRKPISKEEIIKILNTRNEDFSIENVLIEGLPLNFQNIIFIVPLTDLAVEAGQHPLYTHVENTKSEGNLVSDLNQNFIALTTDTFEKLRTAPLTKDMMEQRIKRAELIVFDEQHYPHNADGFRGLVTSSYNFLERYKGNVLYLSGTPIFSEASHAHAVVTKLDRKFISKVAFYLDYFLNESDILESMKDELENGSILFYCKSRQEASRVHNVLLEGGYDVVKITSHEYLRNGNPIEKEEVAKLKGKIAYVATTKITTGVNLDQLIAIYQHGTAFDPFTFVQLTARLRGNGKYFLLKVKNDRVKNENIQNKAIFLCNMAKKFNIYKLSAVWEIPSFKKYIEKNVELSYDKNNLKGFLNVYRSALQLVQSESLGALTRDRQDFEFSNAPKSHYKDEPITKVSKLDENQIKNIFVGADSVNYRKFFEKMLIDSLTRNGKVEVLNDVFELSFDYVRMNNLSWNETVGKNFITEKDEAIRLEKRLDKEDIENEFAEKVNEKLRSIIEYEFLKKRMNNTAINKLLNDERLDREEDKNKLIDLVEKAQKKNSGISTIITALHCYLISPTKIIKTIIADISENGYTTLKRVSELIEQKEYLSTKKSKDIFVNFLKDYFIDDTFDKNSLEYSPQLKRIEGKRIRDVITLPKKDLQILKKIKEEKERELERIKILEAKEKEWLKPYEEQYNCEIIFEEAPAKIETIEELEKQLEDENIPLNQRAKIMQKIHNIEEKKRA